MTNRIATIVVTAWMTASAAAECSSLDQARQLLRERRVGAAIELLESLPDDREGERLLVLTEASNSLWNCERKESLTQS